ncbi:MAG: N-6 DNA methylase [Lachnospiraceae bacterium]|nr:N-6 DNA methylase [Lachnospiraceae bacterium]
MSPPFTFDFSKAKANVGYAFEFPIEREKAPEQPSEDFVRCPYHVPTVDEIIKLIDRSSFSAGKSKLISDMFECGAIAVSNTVDFTQKKARDERYTQIMKGYKPQEQKLLIEIFGKIYALLTSEVYDDGVFGDYLGELFMRCNQGNKDAGQFFTPYHISECMAKTVLTGADAEVKSKGIVTICDPCSGGDGMLMAALDVLKNDFDINYAYHCFMQAGDVDIRCVHMTYLQLALAGVPAIVCHQNTLTNELWSVWKTPAFIFQYLRFRKYDVNISKEKIA